IVAARAGAGGTPGGSAGWRAGPWQRGSPGGEPRGDERRRSRAKGFRGIYFPAAAFATKRPSKVLARSTLAPLSSSSKASSMSAADFMPAAGITPVRDRLVGLDRGEGERLVAEEIIFRHRRGDLLGGRLIEPLQRLVEGVDQRLHGRRILVDEVLPDVEHRRRVRAAENRARPLLRSAVGDDLDVAVLLELGNHRIEVRERVDLALLH